MYEKPSNILYIYVYSDISSEKLDSTLISMFKE